MALVLIADDVNVSREMLARGLREAGHRVILVADGEEAVARFAAERPDAVVLDVTMPKLSGVEACARIKAVDGGYTPVILVSARGDVDSRVAALAVADDFMGKPYDVNEMNARIEAHLRSRRAIADRHRNLGTSPPPPSSADSATGLRPRAQLLDRLTQEWRRAGRANEPLALLVAAADETGDAALAAVGAVFGRAARPVDLAARGDGERVVMLLANTHVPGALAAAERLQRELAGLSPAVAVCIGVACFPGREIATPDDLIRYATRALERAREEGRGQICLFQNQGYIFQREG